MAGYFYLHQLWSGLSRLIGRPTLNMYVTSQCQGPENDSEVSALCCEITVIFTL